MAKATIIEPLGEGEYRIKIERDVASIKVRITELAADLLEWQGTKIPAARAKANAKLLALQAQIDDLELRSGISLQEQLRIETARLTLAIEYEKARTELALLQADVLSMQAEKERLQRASADQTIASAWCADYTTGLTGAVATIEVPGERNGVPVIIQPGYDGNANFDKSRDGKLQPVDASTPEAVFWNWAMLPAWQKWRPTYRLGEIVDLVGDKCTVRLDSARSSQQRININVTDTHELIDIVYMNCNGGAFAVGDRVVVEYFDLENQALRSARVIGFEKEPKQCASEFFCIFADDDLPRGYGTPQPQSYYLTLQAGTWKLLAPDRYEYGNVDWRGDGNKVLTYWGPSSRYWYGIGQSWIHSAITFPNVIPGQTWANVRSKLYDNQYAPLITPNIYRGGAVLCTAPYVVIGCALATFSDTEYVVAICAETTVSAAGYYNSIKHIAYVWDGAAWTKVAERNTSNARTDDGYSNNGAGPWSGLNPYHFSGDGKKAVAVNAEYVEANDYMQDFIVDFTLTSPTSGTFTVASATEGAYSATLTSQNDGPFDKVQIISGDRVVSETDVSADQFESTESSITLSKSVSGAIAADYKGQARLLIKAEETITGAGSITTSVTRENFSYSAKGATGPTIYNWVMSTGISPICEGTELVTYRYRLFVEGLTGANSLIDKTTTRNQAWQFTGSYPVSGFFTTDLDTANVTGIPYQSSLPDYTRVDSYSLNYTNHFVRPNVVWADARLNACIVDASFYHKASAIIEKTSYASEGQSTPLPMFGDAESTVQLVSQTTSTLTGPAVGAALLAPYPEGSAYGFSLIVNGEHVAKNIYLNYESSPFFDAASESLSDTANYTYTYDETHVNYAGYETSPSYAESDSTFLSSGGTKTTTTVQGPYSGDQNEYESLQSFVANLYKGTSRANVSVATNHTTGEIMQSLLVKYDLGLPSVTHKPYVAYVVNGSVEDAPALDIQPEEGKRGYFTVVSPTGQ